MVSEMEISWLCISFLIVNRKSDLVVVLSIIVLIILSEAYNLINLIVLWCLTVFLINFMCLILFYGE